MFTDNQDAAEPISLSADQELQVAVRWRSTRLLAPGVGSAGATARTKSLEMRLLPPAPPGRRMRQVLTAADMPAADQKSVTIRSLLPSNVRWWTPIMDRIAFHYLWRSGNLAWIVVCCMGANPTRARPLLLRVTGEDARTVIASAHSPPPPWIGQCAEGSWRILKPSSESRELGICSSWKDAAGNAWVMSWILRS